MSGLDAAGLTLRVYRLVEEHAGGDVEQAARALGVAPRGLYRILAITDTPDLEVLAALVRVWKADAVWVLTGVSSLASDDVPPAERVAAADALADIAEILVARSQRLKEA
jgi:hypothetical protein